MAAPMTAEMILALMLALTPPGKTLHSNTVVDEGARPAVLDGGRYRVLGADEAEPYACQQRGNPACRRPRYSKPRKAWLRTETWREGLPRFWMIAQAIHKWTAGEAALAKILVVTSFHESGGWWTMTHGGFCHRPWQRRCKWEDAGKAWGLWQVLLTRHPGSKVPGVKNLRAKDLVGITPANTRRAAWLATRTFRAILKRCKGHVAPCVWVAYGGNVNAKDARIRARVASWQKLGRLGPDDLRLDVAVREVLGLPVKKKTKRAAAASVGACGMSTPGQRFLDASFGSAWTRRSWMAFGTSSRLQSYVRWPLR